MPPLKPGDAFFIAGRCIFVPPPGRAGLPSGGDDDLSGGDVVGVVVGMARTAVNGGSV